MRATPREREAADPNDQANRGDFIYTKQIPSACGSLLKEQFTAELVFFFRSSVVLWRSLL